MALKLCECGCGLPTPIATKNIHKDGVVKGQPRRFIYGHQFRLARNKYKGTHHHCSSGYRTPTFISWSQMRQRCLNPKHHAWALYGGRGIQVCRAWLEHFEAFLADMGPRPSPQHSIDRLDNDGPYAPENCRWATKAEQRINQRPPNAARLAQLARARAKRSTLRQERAEANQPQPYRRRAPKEKASS